MAQEMLARLAELLVAVLAIYAVAGFVFALAFVVRGVERIDPAAKGSGVGFRLLILPGCVALWPMLLRRWWRGAPPPPERTAHRQAAVQKGPT